MRKKRIHNLLRAAADLALIAELDDEQVVCCSVYRHGEISIHLKALELARVFRLLRVPRSRLKLSAGERCDVHITFEARGATWTTCVLRKDFDSAEWQELVGGDREPQLPAAETTPLLEFRERVLAE